MSKSPPGQTFNNSRDVAVRFDDELHKLTMAEIARKHIGISAFIRMAVAEYFENHGSSAQTPKDTV